MRKEDILKLPSMPASGPSYPAGPYRFIHREFMVITYETDPEIVRHQLPEPLEPVDQPLVHYEWIKMPDSSGFGDYTECGMVLPCRFQGEEANFVVQMRRRSADLRRPRDLGLPEEVRPSQAGDRQRHPHRHPGICRTTGRHGNDGLQARGHGRQRRAHDRAAVQDSDQSKNSFPASMATRKSASWSPTI
jgi:hypothetical protein